MRWITSTDARASGAWLVLMLLATLVCGSASADCPNGRIRYELPEGRTVEKEAAFCLEKDGIHVTSSACHGSLKSCAAALRKNAPGDPLPEVRHELGSPGFRNCRKLGGIPRFAEFDAGQGWKKIAACFFDKDRVFLDNDTLFGLTRE